MKISIILPSIPWGGTNQKLFATTRSSWLQQQQLLLRRGPPNLLFFPLWPPPREELKKQRKNRSLVQRRIVSPTSSTSFTPSSAVAKNLRKSWRGAVYWLRKKPRTWRKYWLCSIQQSGTSTLRGGGSMSTQPCCWSSLFPMSSAPTCLSLKIRLKIAASWLWESSARSSGDARSTSWRI